VLTVPVATDPDPERGRVEVVRLGLAYATAPAYAAQLRRAGLGDALDAAQARRAAGDLEGAVAAAGERLLGAFGLWGTPSSVAAGVAAYRRAGVSCVNVHLLPPASGAGEGHYREWLDALAGEFGPELASGALTGAGA